MPMAFWLNGGHLSHFCVVCAVSDTIMHHNKSCNLCICISSVVGFQPL